LINEVGTVGYAFHLLIDQTSSPVAIASGGALPVMPRPSACFFNCQGQLQLEATEIKVASASDSFKLKSNMKLGHGVLVRPGVRRTPPKSKHGTAMFMRKFPHAAAVYTQAVGRKGISESYSRGEQANLRLRPMLNNTGLDCDLVY
jgi:hypothetical protein